MKCETAILLVEKLADGEASADEKALAEQHVSSCTDCRSHYTFVKALASASEKIELPPAPPQAYWEHLPSRIIARLHEDESPGIWQQSTTTRKAGGLMKAPRRGLHRAEGAKAPEVLLLLVFFLFLLVADVVPNNGLV